MFFEGSEKKLEIVVQAGSVDFRSLGLEFWTEVVECSHAKILSQISNEDCDAYLLSESSLFVWKEQITMITCGTTTLAPSILKVLDRVGLERIATLFYERKNEYFPHHQKTDFYEDIRMLRQRVPGLAYRLGNADEHHLFLFHLDKAYEPNPSDCTLEMLMYNLQGSSREVFDCNKQTLENIRLRTGVDRLFEGFQIDDYLFSPCGYSLNGIRGTDYYTVHVTPEENGSYVSFETNIELGDGVVSTLRRVLEVFNPMSFDVVIFRPKEQQELVEIPGFTRRNSVRQSLSCGYEVNFSCHAKEIEDIQPAYLITES